MSMEEIEKLRERVQRDPDSKLFLPLAEEYRKAGMYEEAIEVLKKGLERQPGYTSAKVALGKIYFEQGRVEDAQSVFEEVALTVPDNLFAKKKLVEIYKQKGEIDRAKDYCKKVLELNPMDEEVRAILEDLIAQGSEEGEVVETAEEETTAPPVYAEPPVADEVQETEQTVAVEDVVHPSEAEETEAEEPVEAVSEGFLKEEPEHEEAAFEEYKSFSSFIGEEVLEPGQIKEEPVEELPEESSMFAIPEDEFSQTEKTSEYGLENSSLLNSSYYHLLQSSDEIVQKAEELIRAEQYMKAFDLYAEALREDPDNLQIKQRIEELKQLMKLLGKDVSKLVEDYDKLLRGIKERRDEFFGSS